MEGSRYLAPDPEVADPARGAADQFGSLIYQDARWRPLPWLRADARLTLFDTDGYDARLYAFENDLTGVFAIPALSGRGARGYVLLAATPAEGVTVQAKLATTWLRRVNRIGSGPNAVDGQRVSDLGLQVRVRM